jgi:ubiquinone/menaquinone biosynthesis C-methylase UbiE
MKLKREATLKIHFLLDQCIPPILRDQKWFMWLPFKLLFGKKANAFLDFKQHAPFLSTSELTNYYQEVASVCIERETDLNQACVEKIEQQIKGKTILDIACGTGFMAKRLANKQYTVTAADFILPNSISSYSQITWVESHIESTPFENQQFDTVICAHTLEHVQNISKTIKELRRITKQRLIIIVPKQRPYLYTFDLHLHFFPYATIFLTAIGNVGNPSNLLEIEGDWFYVEDFQ